ncbi:MAG: glycosyltransferase family 4 protein [Deltaproteobacteria bacterium]|nr:glycosyltransferase family 4 protein [Deltaproteobacteria bacterium]
MRFALIGPSAPYRGGIAEYHDRLAGALAAAGHEVRRISFRRMYPRILFPGRTQFVESSAGDARSEGPAALPPPEAILDSVGPASWLAAARRAAEAEVALVEWWHPFFAPALAVIAARLRRGGVPAIFVCHNLDPHEPMPGGGWLAARALGRAAAFVAQSERDAARLGRSHPGRPVALVLPPATTPPPCPHGGARDACAAALGIPGAPRRLLFFGYVREYKGLPTLIEALTRLDPGVQLVVAGEIYHHDAGHYRASAIRHGVGDRVVIMDRFLGASEVGCCFHASDLVVLPYWEASQSAVVPLAMASGRAVVATRVGGLPDLVRDGVTGLLVPPRDPVALADAIAHALDVRDEMGRAARDAAVRLDWRAAARTIADLAATAICEPSGPC